MLLNENEARQFLAKVMPWPPEGEVDGYCNLHWTEPRRDDPSKPFWNGRAARTPDELIRTLAWVAGLSNARDIYVCMSRQRDAEERVSKKNADYHYFRANRSGAAALGLRSVYLDLDFKQYPSPHAANEALKKFLHESGLPRPSVMVFTGGGMHLHWTADRILTPPEWHPLAAALVGAVQKHGLKCDTACSIDIARILRVPGTRNFKYVPDRPVELLWCAPTDYPIEQLQQMLRPYVGLAPQRTSASSATVIPFPAKAPLKEPSELAAGIEERRLPYRPVAKECAFFGHALKTGGSDYANPLWHHSVLMTVFMERGRELAHLISQGHASYTHEETEKLFDRKVGDHKLRSIGYPSCRSIQQAGCGFCAACPHLAKGKSPLHLALAPPAPAAKVARASLPAGYHQNAAGEIFKTVKDEDGNDTEEKVSQYALTDAYLTEEPGVGWVLNFTAHLHEHTREIRFPMRLNTAAKRAETLLSQGLFMDSYKHMGGLIVAWSDELQRIKNTIVKTDTFGWVSDDGRQLSGFAYGGMLWTPNGSQQVPLVKTSFAAAYQPSGELEPWKQTSSLITNQRRPALNAILASAFGAPLIGLTEHSGLCLSAHSRESGIGKTTAIKVAQSVWGAPSAISNLGDTENSIDKKLRELRSLPLYWDEMHTADEEVKDVSRFLFRIAGGKGRSRLNRSSDLAVEGTWKTMVVSASNKSLIDGMVMKHTPAGLMRLFEFEVPPPGPHGRVASAGALVHTLEQNYGIAGRIYAEWLGKNHSSIERELFTLHQTVASELGIYDPSERFWQSSVAVLTLGARYANQLGLTQIDEEALYRFLLDNVVQLRAERAQQAVDMSDPFQVSSILSDFLETARPHTVFSDKLFRTSQPPSTQLTTLPSLPTTNAVYWAHVGRETNTVDIKYSFLEDWLVRNRYVPRAFTKALKTFAKAEFVRKIFGVGVATMPIDNGVLESLLHVDKNALLQAAQGATNALRNTNESRSAEDP